MIAQAVTLAEDHGVRLASQASGVARSNLYRWTRPFSPPVEKHRPSPQRSLGESEQDRIHAVLNSERFRDSAPREVYASLLDEEVYLCSWRTMYRILAKHNLVHERRKGHRRASYQRPELLAEEPNRLWSWDITWLKGPRTGSYFYLYVIIDVFSRYVPGYLLAEHESADVAITLVETTRKRQRIEAGRLVLHADRGAPMKADSLAQHLDALGIGKSHSRPTVCDDNPYSEAQFKTVKYHHTFPQRFASLQAARDWARGFFDWYNNHHRHSSLALMTPASVHYRRADAIGQERQQVLNMAFSHHPERFVKGSPIHPEVPHQVWINPPKNQPIEEGRF